MSNAYQLRRQKTANNVEVDFDNLAKEALELVEGAVKRSFTQSNIVLRREIKRESLQLEKDFENLEKDKIIYKTQLKNVEDILKANTEIVRLDIGGVLYTTTAQTIRNQPGNLLHQIIERRVSAQIDDEGRIFIDRDGKRFGQLLDFMRNGTIQLPREIKERERLILEASFYNLDIMAGVDSSVIDHNVNLLNEVTMGGRAKVIGIYGVNSTVYNAGTMNGVHTANWPNNGCLFDEDRTRDDPNLSYRVNPGCGTTWVNSIPGSSVGVLVIDLGDAVPISQINVFSMRSDGQVTNVKFLSYPVDSGLPASATAYTGEFNGWQQVGSEVFVPRGHDVDANTVGGPATISFDQIQTRYLMMQARNDGSNGDPSYIEVRQIKAYP